MIPVRECTSAADVIANYKRTRDVFFRPRQPILTQIISAPKEAVSAQVSALTSDPQQGSEINSESVNTSGEVDAQPERDIIDLTSEGLVQVPEAFRPRTKAMRFVQAIAADHGVTADDILGPCRDKKIKDARFEAVAKVYVEFPQWSLQKIGNFFNRDHTTILNALKKKGVWERTRAW